MLAWYSPKNSVQLQSNICSAQKPCIAYRNKGGGTTLKTYFMCFKKKKSILQIVAWKIQNLHLKNPF